MRETLSENFHLQRCEPGVAAGLLDAEPAFGDRGRKPVSVKFDAEGQFSSSGFAYDDYWRCHIETRKVARGRRNETPRWAVNFRELRELVTRFMELRAQIRVPDSSSSLIQRLNLANQKILSDVPRKVQVLDRLCSEYLAAKHADRSERGFSKSRYKTLTP